MQLHEDSGCTLAEFERMLCPYANKKWMNNTPNYLQVGCWEGGREGKVGGCTCAGRQAGRHAPAADGAAHAFEGQFRRGRKVAIKDERGRRRLWAV